MKTILTAIFFLASGACVLVWPGFAQTTDSSEVLKARQMLVGGFFTSENDAIDLLSLAIKKNSQDMEAYQLRGIAYTQKLDFAAGTADFAKVAENRKDWLSYYNLAYSELLQSRISEAIADLGRASALGPKKFIIYSLRAEAHRIAGDTKAAEDDYSMALEVYPKADSVYAQRATYLYQAGKQDRALLDISRALDLKKVAYYHYLKAMILARKNQPSAGMAELDKADRLKPNNGMILWGKGLLSELLNNPEAAKKFYSQAIQVGLAGQGYSSRGVLAYNQGKQGQAESDLKNALDNGTNNPMAYLYFGKIYYLKNNKAAANTYFQQALALSPSDPELYYNLGNFYAAVKDAENARKQFSEAIARDNKNSEFYLARAKSSILMSDFSNALDDTNRATEINPTDGESFYVKSQAQAGAGYTAEAKKTANTACRLGYKKSC